jgi:hypothetical protein
VGTVAEEYDRVVGVDTHASATCARETAAAPRPGRQPPRSGHLSRGRASYRTRRSRIGWWWRPSCSQSGANRAAPAGTRPSRTARTTSTRGPDSAPCPPRQRRAVPATFLDRRVGVPAVDDVQVDVVGAQPAQAVVNLYEDRLTPQPSAVGVRPHLAEDLGCDDHLVASDLLEQYRAEDFLAGAVGVHVRAVSEKLTPASSALCRKGMLWSSGSDQGARPAPGCRSSCTPGRAWRPQVRYSQASDIPFLDSSTARSAPARAPRRPVGLGMVGRASRSSVRKLPGSNLLIKSRICARLEGALCRFTSWLACQQGAQVGPPASLALP